ncbi:MAG: hypothetical protein Q7U72_09245, partial [Brevundimonas sp.]|nr:hypothetical protein [Brevundimonas sp.]
MIRQDASALRFARALSPSLLALAVAAGLAGPAMAQSQAPAAPANPPAPAEVSPPAPAQAEPAQEQRLTIARILVRGNQRIDQT